MRTYICVVFLLFLLPVACFSQADSTYIRSFKHKIAVSPYLSQSFVSLIQTLDRDRNISYMPNNPPSLGLGFSVNNTMVSFGFGYGIDFMRDKSRGKTHAIDLQGHNYSRKFALDLVYQDYKGFYKENDMTDEIVGLAPDLSIMQLSFHGQYILNNKKFSYKAAFSQSEKQIKSAGSFLISAGASITRIASDTSFVFRDKNTFQNFQFGVGCGYAYTWVLGKHWFVSGSTTVGIHFGSEHINKFGKQKLEVYPSVYPRFSAVYNLDDKWTVGFLYVNNITFPAMSESDEVNLGLLSGNMRVTFVKRFNLNSFFIGDKISIPPFF